MPGVVARAGSRRRSMNEINMVPFIDVMLVLLIIFMVTAPLITTGLIDVPTVGKAQQRPQRVVEVLVGSDEKLRLRVDQEEPAALTLAQLAARVRDKQAGNAEVPVVISADKSVRYESVVRVMDTLQRAGVHRVGLSNLQQVTLATVAPGIAEALVATAIGLFAAIPAVVAYNRYSHDIDRLAIRFESFMEEFSNILQRNAGQPPVAAGPR